MRASKDCYTWIPESTVNREQIQIAEVVVSQLVVPIPNFLSTSLSPVSSIDISPSKRTEEVVQVIIFESLATGLLLHIGSCFLRR